MSPTAWVLILILSLIWGGSFLSIRIALNEIGPLTSVAHRVGWAAMALCALVVWQRHAIPWSPRLILGFLGMGVLNNVLPFTLMAWGQLHIETGLTAILNASTAIFGVLVAACFLTDERLTWRKTFGVGIGFPGVTIAIGLGSLADFDLRALGQWAVIAGTVSYALAGVWARKMLSGLTPQVAAAGMLTASTLIMIPMAWAIEGPISLTLTPATWLAIGYYALIATATAYLIYYRVLSLAGSGNVMLCTLLVAPVAIVLGAVVLGEELNWTAYLGFAVLSIGLVILNGERR